MRTYEEPMLKKGHYHFVGVAGVGMSAVAQAVLWQGCAVSGSDRHLDCGLDLAVLKKLSSAGIKLHPQDGSGIDPRLNAVVVSTAIEEDNPDLIAARELDIPVMHRSEILSRLVRDNRCVAIAGTSGKSTVTGMVGWILDRLGLDPNVVNGAQVLNWMSENTIGNTRNGNSDLWVIEADESDKSLLNYHPEHAVITNMSADHFDLEETVSLFRQFASQVEKGAVGALSGKPYMTDFEPEVHADSSSFTIDGTEFYIPLPGAYNAENALHAIMLCRKLGLNLEEIAMALSEFKGIHRRLEKVGSSGNITVIDDYAHNPAKIRASLNAVSHYCRAVHLIWRPHGYRPLRTMLDELTSTFTDLIGEKDQLIILPVHDAGGTADRSIGSEALVSALQKKGVRATETSPEKAIEITTKSAKKGDVIITMGARDPGLPALAKAVAKILDQR